MGSRWEWFAYMTRAMTLQLIWNVRGCVPVSRTYISNMMLMSLFWHIQPYMTIHDKWMWKSNPVGESGVRRTSGAKRITGFLHWKSFLLFIYYPGRCYSGITQMLPRTYQEIPRSYPERLTMERYLLIIYHSYTYPLQWVNEVQTFCPSFTQHLHMQYWVYPPVTMKILCVLAVVTAMYAYVTRNWLGFTRRSRSEYSRKTINSTQDMARFTMQITVAYSKNTIFINLVWMFAWADSRDQSLH